MYMDFDPVELFRDNVHDPLAGSSCGFMSKNEKKVAKYLDHLEKYILDHNIEPRVQDLREVPFNLS
jgi:hypothetical protein